MTEDPYFSPQPVVKAIAGFFMAMTTLLLPLIVTEDRVKFNRAKPALNSGKVHMLYVK